MHTPHGDRRTIASAIGLWKPLRSTSGISATRRPPCQIWRKRLIFQNPIYKFFDSKQAIGEAICANRLAKISEVVNDAIADAPTASEKLRRLLNALIEAGNELFFHDRKLYDIAAVASRERWPSAAVYQQQLRQLIQHIIQEGRQAGEFERKTPLDETADAISLVMQPYICPLQLQFNLDTAPTAAVLLSSLILRSLAIRK